MSALTLVLSKVIPERWERGLRNFRDQHLRFYKIEKLPSEVYADPNNRRSISFCTNCKNRLYHLCHTVEENIKANQSYGKVEFVLVNYNSQDGMHEWVRKNLLQYIESGILNYYYASEPLHYHASKAKNLAHRLATGDIVCNLDGDNFTGKDFAFYINYLFGKFGDEIILQFKKAPYWGTEGRIVLSRKNFEKLGGYDESFYPTGHQDHDLMDRAKAYGLSYQNITIENFLRYLSNSTKEKSTGLGMEQDYYTLRNLNRVKSAENLATGKLTVNTDHEWGKIKVFKNFSKEPYSF